MSVCYAEISKWHYDLYKQRCQRWLVMSLIHCIATVIKVPVSLSQFLVKQQQRLIPIYADLAYDDKTHTYTAYGYLKKKDYLKAFTRGWCYSLAIAAAQAGFGEVVCFGRLDSKKELEPVHAAVRRQDGTFLDIAGTHPDIASVQAIASSQWELEICECDAKKAAEAFVICRAIWLNMDTEQLQAEVDLAVREVQEHWKVSGFAPYPALG